LPEGLRRKNLIVFDLDNRQAFTTLTEEVAPAFAIKARFLHSVPRPATNRRDEYVILEISIGSYLATFREKHAKSHNETI
jgi:hypothetical protein